MRLPHVTVEFREEESFALGKVSWPLIVGFAVHWAWTFILFAGPGMVYLDMSPLVRSVGLVTSMVALSVTLFCYGFFLNQMRRLFEGVSARKRIRTAGACAVCLGTALLWASAFAEGAGVPVGVLSGLLTGTGSAVLLMSYGVSFSVCDVATASFSTAVALMLSPMLFLPIVCLFRALPIAGLAVCLAMPFVELLCLNRSSQQLVDKLEFNSITMPVRLFPFSLHVFLPSLVFGFIIGIIRTIVFVGVPFSSEFTAYSQGFVLAGVCAGAFALAAMLTQRQTNNFMFRTLLPVAAVLISSLYFAGGLGEFYAIFALFTSYLLLEACTWVFFADISQRFRISAFTVFGFGRGSFTVGSVASYCFMLAQPMGVPSGMPDFGALAAVSLAAIVLGYSFLPKNAELRDTLKVSARCLSLWNADEEPAQGLSEAEELAYEADRAAQSAFSSTAPADGASSAAESAGPSTATEKQAAQQPQEDAAGSSRGAAGSKAAAAGREAEPQPAARSLDGARSGFQQEQSRSAQAKRQTDSDAERMKVIGNVEDRIEATEEEKRQHLGRFKRKCAVVAETYLLSRKETEVLFLLAKGKNSAAIQEQLYISAGTANTHMRRIYRKLDVHSQQELIKLVESVDVSGWDD